MRNANGISKLLWLGAGLSLLSFAILIGTIIYQANIPKFEKQLREARLMQDDDPERAETLFKESVEGAEKAGIKGEPLLKRIKEYGDFLADYRFKYEEAIAVFNHGIELARRSKDSHWEAEYYEGLAGMQYWAVRAGALSRLDPAPALKAMELYPEKFQSPTLFAAVIYWDLAQAYIGTGEFGKGDEYLEKAKYTYDNIKEELPEGYYRARIESMVGQGKLRDANALFVEQMLEFGDDKYRSDRLRADFYCAMDEVNPQAIGLRRQSVKLLESREYEQLEKLAAEFDKDQNATASGTWRIEYFYDGMDDTEDYASDKRWQRRIKQLQDWMHARPASDVAKIAYADVMSSYAWKIKKKEDDADGNKQAFEERIDYAWETLQQVDQDARSKGWYDTALNVTWAPRFSAEEYNEVYDECRKKFPSFYSAVMNKTCYLRSEDEDKIHDSERYLEQEARRLPHGRGDELYGLVLSWLDSGSEPNIFSDENAANKYSWPRAKSGLQALIKKHPDSPEMRAALSCMALEVDDIEVAKHAFDDVKMPPKF